MESRLGEGLRSAAAFLVQEPAWTPPTVVAASKVVALRERAPGESEESYQAYRRTRRAQQKAINEEQRPPRDRTGRKRPAQDAQRAQARIQKHVRRSLGDALDVVASSGAATAHLVPDVPCPSPPAMNHVWTPDSTWCSCKFGSPCASIMTCTDWHARFEVAARNGWQDHVTVSEQLSMADVKDHFGEWLADRSVRFAPIAGRASDVERVARASVSPAGLADEGDL